MSPSSTNTYTKICPAPEHQALRAFPHGTFYLQTFSHTLISKQFFLTPAPGICFSCIFITCIQLFFGGWRVGLATACTCSHSLTLFCNYNSSSLQLQHTTGVMLVWECRLGCTKHSPSSQGPSGWGISWSWPATQSRQKGNSSLTFIHNSFKQISWSYSAISYSKLMWE